MNNQPEQNNLQEPSPPGVSKLPCLTYIFVLSVLAILSTGYIANMIVNSPNKLLKDFLQSSAEAFKTRLVVKKKLFSAVKKLKETPKIVVMTAQIDLRLEEESGKTVLWNMLSLGTTTVELFAPENKVQFVICTASITSDCFRYSSERKILRFKVPEPVIDPAIVEVQSDPEKIEVRKEIGWGRLSAYSGQELELKLKKQLRDKVIERGKSDELLLDAARNRARKVFQNLLKKQFKAIDQEIIIHLE